MLKLQYMSLGFKHLRKRTKPNKNFNKGLDVVMYCVAIISPLAVLPQVYEVFSTKSAGSLSLPTWLTLACINLVWVFYGIYHHDKPITVTNVLVAIVDFSVVAGILLYR
jgi:uncharacterized protein with PQ loop repeat